MKEERDYKFGRQLEKILYNRAKRSLKLVENVNKDSSENGYLDSQWFLDFHDDLNGLSIDEDREDTKAGNCC